MGGSDQWGNIVNGIDLGRRMSNAQLFALTSPLITTSSGAKMGKTAAGAVWLNADLVSPYDYWQYWRNTEDGDVARFLKLFTMLPLDEIARLAALKGKDINEAKKVLATEATALVHGRAAADEAAETARKTFEEGALAETLPTVEIARTELDKASACSPPLCKAGLVASNGEARRQIKSGGLKVNDVAVTDEKMMLTTERPHARRRDQAVARQETARAAEAGTEPASPRSADEIADRTSPGDGNELAQQARRDRRDRIDRDARRARRPDRLVGDAEQAFLLPPPRNSPTIGICPNMLLRP